MTVNYDHLFGLYPWIFPLVIVLIAWTLTAKGLGLWRAARNGDKEWFIVMLVLNTLGILELIYLARHPRQK